MTNETKKISKTKAIKCKFKAGEKVFLKTHIQIEKLNNDYQ